MSYLPELLRGQPVALIYNKNIPVALKAVEVDAGEPYPHKSIRHILINASGRPIGMWSMHPQDEDGVARHLGDVVTLPREGLERWATPAQHLTVSTYALMELMPMHPSSLLALERGNAEKWKDTGDNVGMVDIPLLYPHLLPFNTPERGIEAGAGLMGYHGDSQMHTDINTDAGQMAYAALLEPMLEKLDRLVMQPNGFKNGGNSYVNYIRRSNAA